MAANLSFEPGASDFVEVTCTGETTERELSLLLADLERYRERGETRLLVSMTQAERMSTWIA